MSKHIEEAKAAIQHSQRQSFDTGDLMLHAQASALIAIAEQLQLANRIAVQGLVAEAESKSGQYGVYPHLTGNNHLKLFDHPATSSGRAVLKPEIAELLGVDHEA